MSRPAADLALVVCAGPGAGPAIASVRRSARRADVSLEVILVRTEPSSAGESEADLAVDAFPLDSAYLRNRGLEAASAAAVAFVDRGAEVVRDWAAALASAFAGPPAPAAVRGRGTLAFERAALMAVGGFDRRLGGPGAEPGLELEDALLRLAARGHRILRAPALAARGGERAAVEGRLLARLARRHRSLAYVLPRMPAAARSLVTRRARADGGPAALLERLPGELRALLADAGPVPSGASYRSKAHVRFELDGRRVLHAYVNPSPRLRRALAEREAIRAGSGLDGVPRLHRACEGFDALWVLEEAVTGRQPRPEEVRAWFPAVADWAVALGGPRGRALDESEDWRAHREEALAVARDAGLDALAEDAFAAVSALPSRHMHGDFQRRNILVDGDRIGLVDWEGAWEKGIPGLDLVFLALLARGDDPDASLLLRLAYGDDPDWAPVTPRLERLGLDRAHIRPALVVMLATWALAERRRLARLGAPPGEPVWEPMFRRLAPSLAAGDYR
jgi:hypothetical protein